MRAHRQLLHVVLAATIALAACAPTAPELIVGRARQASAPTAGKADGKDKADQACQVVLRSIGRQPGNNGYLTQCTAGVCNWVWVAQVEVAEQVQGAKVGLLYRRAGDATWWQVTGKPSSTSAPGYVRHEVTIHEHLIGPAASAAELAAVHVDLIPYLELTDGTRIFDHNRVSGPFDNYVLDEQGYFAVGDDQAACEPIYGRISFFTSWDEYQQGNLRQGGHLVLDYDLSRLPQCRGTHNGSPAWDIIAHVRFAPGGQLVSGSVRTFVSNQGVPTNTAERKELQVKIPVDATAVEVWFQNYTGAGSSCVAWDSNLGANYSYTIWPPESHPRCKGVQRWSAVNSDMPYASSPCCLDYDVDQHHGAKNCELYLSGIGRGYTGHYGIPNRWVEAYISVGPQQGQLLGAGMFTRYRDKQTGQQDQRLSLGRQVSSDTWQAGFISLRSSVGGGKGFDYDVEQLAFFIDVRRPTGEVVRLWQSRDGANYGWADAFGLPTSTKSIPYGNIQYASPAAAIFDVKQTCAK